MYLMKLVIIIRINCIIGIDLIFTLKVISKYNLNTLVFKKKKGFKHLTDL